MKLKHFYGSISVLQENGYTNNLEFELKRQDEEAIGDLIFRYPYGNVSPEKANAVNSFVKTISDAFDRLKHQLTTANKLLKEEEYAPKVIESAINRVGDAVSDTAPDTESEGL